MRYNGYYYPEQAADLNLKRGMAYQFLEVHFVTVSIHYRLSSSIILLSYYLITSSSYPMRGLTPPIFAGAHAARARGGSRRPPIIWQPFGLLKEEY